MLSLNSSMCLLRDETLRALFLAMIILAGSEWYPYSCLDVERLSPYNSCRLTFLSWPWDHGSWNHLELDGHNKHLWVVFLFICWTEFPWSRPRARLGQHKEGRVGLLDLRQQSCWVWLSGEIIFIFFIFLENTWMQPGIFSSSSSSSLSSSMSRCNSVSLLDSSSALVATIGQWSYKRCSGDQLSILLWSLLLAPRQFFSRNFVTLVADFGP